MKSTEMKEDYNEQMREKFQEYCDQYSHCDHCKYYDISTGGIQACRERFVLDTEIASANKRKEDARDIADKHVIACANEVHDLLKDMVEILGDYVNHAPFASDMEYEDARKTRNIILKRAISVLSLQYAAPISSVQCTFQWPKE